MMYTYLILNILTISFPLIRSFENRIRYYSNWLYILLALIINSIFFIIWDHFFTIWGVWSFNEQYILGLKILDLPIEEWMFFFTIPFACIFIYEVLKYFVRKNPIEKYCIPISFILMGIFFSVGLTNLDKLYTSINFTLCGIFLGFHLFYFGTRYLANFYLTYLVHLVPFVIVNGILTFLPVVIYNNAENLSFRVITIPIEDFGYSFLLLLNNISVYEYIKKEYPRLKLRLLPSFNQ